MSEVPSSPSSSPPPSSLREEAATWFARMRGDHAAQYREAFEDWLARGALHRAAYNRIGEVFAAAKVLKASEDRRLDRVTAPRFKRAMFAGMIVASVAAGTIWMRTDAGGAAPFAGVHIAAADRAVRLPIRTITFSSGERVILDCDGVLASKVAGQRRLVRLEHGRARFVLRTPREVLAGASEIRSGAATFDLWLHDDGTLDTRVFAGAVQIRPAVLTRASGDVRHQVVLMAGTRYRLTGSGQETMSRVVADAAWPTGVLEFQAAPLGDVIEEANRYSPLKIVLADSTLGSRRVSGRFRIDDPARLAHRLAAALSLTINRAQPGFIILLPRN